MSSIVHSPMPIIVGAPRSGTTLLRLMLDAHPDLAIPPETGFLSLGTRFRGESAPVRKEFFDALVRFPPDAPAWRDFRIPEATFWQALTRSEPFAVADGYRAFYRLYAARFGKRRWGDKTPVHAFHIDGIREVLPEAHIVHLIRDGRDVCLSLRPMWFSPGPDIDVQARQWCEFVTAAREQGDRCSQYIEVRYEDLVLRPQETLRMVCRFLQLDYDDAMLTYHLRAADRLEEHGTRLRSDGSIVVTKQERFHQQHRTTQPPDDARVLAWRSAMGRDERLRFEAIAGHLLADLGYEVDA